MDCPCEFCPDLDVAEPVPTYDYMTVEPARNGHILRVYDGEAESLYVALDAEYLAELVQEIIADGPPVA